MGIIKNKFLIAFIVSIIPMTLAFVSAKDNGDILQTLKIGMQNKIPFYEKMATCTPFEYLDKHNVGTNSPEISILYKVHGKKGNVCHVQAASEHCYYPLEVSKKFADDTIALYKRKIKIIDSKQEYFYSTSDPENAYFNKMHNKYCKIEF